MVILFLRCELICNVDGIEWRRAKWSNFAQKFLKFCESCAAKSKAKLIFDAYAIRRYFELNHQVSGTEIFYGTEDLDISQIQQKWRQKKVKFNNFDLVYRSYDVVVMRLEPENNIETIVDGYSLFSTEKTLVIIGPSTKFFDKIVKPKIDATRNIIYLGPVYERDALAQIRFGADLYIHGHSVGGTNPVLIEAISFGRPILAFEVYLIEKSSRRTQNIF